MSGLITLLTDFGTRDAFVGIMKGVMLSIDPALRYQTGEELRADLASFLAKHAEHTDAATLATFMSTLFGEQITEERGERDDMMAEASQLLATETRLDNAALVTEGPRNGAVAAATAPRTDAARTTASDEMPTTMLEDRALRERPANDQGLPARGAKADCSRKSRASSGPNGCARQCAVNRAIPAPSSEPCGTTTPLTAR